MSLRLAILAVAALLVPQLSGAQSPLVVSGSSTIYPLMVDIARRFEQLNPDASIKVRSTGTGKGIAELRAGVAEIAMVSRPLVDDERLFFSFALCRDGAAIVVHRSNPVKGMNRQQLAGVLTGRIRDWKQLGARPGPIRLAWRSEDQAIPELILRHLKLKPEQVRSHAVFFENADAVEFVARDRGAVTVAALGVAERAAKSGVAVKLLAFEGVAASTRALRVRSYSLSRPLLLVTKSLPEGLQKRLIDFSISRAVNDLHAKHGFVPYED